MPRIWPTFRGHRDQNEQNIFWTTSLNQGGTNRNQCTETCDLVCADPLAHPDRTPKTRSPWPTLLGFRSSQKYLYLHYLCKLLTCGHQIWIVGVPEMVNKRLGFDVTGVKMDKSNFGTNRVGQIVTAVLYIYTCNLVCTNELANPDCKQKSRSSWPTFISFSAIIKYLWLMCNSLEPADLRSPNLHRGCIWHGCRVTWCLT